MTRDRAKPGEIFPDPARASGFSSFNERILHNVFGFLAVLQNAVSNREKRPTVCANDHFKGFSVAMNGRPVLFTFTGIHCVAI